MGSLTDGLSLDPRLRRGWRAVRRAVLARRRPLAALFVGLAVVAGVRAAAEPPAPLLTVLVARQDLASGAVLTPGNVIEVGFAPGSVPSGFVSDPTGRTLAAPLRQGEPITDVRLVGPALAEGYPGLIAAPVRLPDEVAVSLLSVGDRIDLVAVDPVAGGARDLALGAPVLALPPGQDGDGQAGRLVVLGVPEGSRADLADAAVQAFLSFTFSALT